jgi:hypothetical protein
VVSVDSALAEVFSSTRETTLPGVSMLLLHCQRLSQSIEIPLFFASWKCTTFLFLLCVTVEGEDIKDDSVLLKTPSTRTIKFIHILLRQRWSDDSM